MVYRTDLDHPNSMHNQVTQQNVRVSFPSTQQVDQKAEFTLNGYFDKHPVTLKNVFEPHKN